MKKICYIVSTLNKTGVTNILLELIKKINKKNYEVLIISLSKSDENSYQNEIEKMGIRIINLNLNRFESMFKSKKLIQKIINENNIKIVHSHGLRADYFNSRLKGVLKISTIHNFPFEDYELYYGKLKGKIMAILNIKFLKSIDYPIACSKSISEKFLKNVSMRVDYIQNGIDIEKYFPLNGEAKEKLKKKLNIPENRILYIVSGKIIERKNIDFILESFQKTSINNQEILLIIGDGHLLTEYKQKYNIKNIIFLGNRNNVSDYLKIADCYISASKSEGLPNSVLEAMATNLPCYLSEIDSHLELGLMKEFYFSLKNQKELIQKLIEFRHEVYNKNIISNRKIVIQNFTNILMVQKYEEYYKKVKKV